ncbi:MAG: glycosyl transferase family 2 [Leptolyngbya foveolarum]|uniref:Glycosyl transferase family 2 n=1 Tax=Leptolyngbya foveolarum TaxID=47253 RepID=A0A2W4U3D0_9CYAN|nr:MAG: glycosyl transferase family 2 [Leptolyngbya foveolarum]
MNPTKDPEAMKSTMRNHSLVSVIIIFLNGEAFIEEAIASVFAQTHSIWELLLVDDGSTDGSSAIAQQYAQQYPDRVRYLEHDAHQNRGMSAARNLGICHAKGDYIGFLDADDLWLPDKLTQQLEIFKRFPEAAMVYGRAQIWYSWAAPNCSLPASQSDYFYDLGVSANSLVYPPSLFEQLLKNKHQTPIPSNALMQCQVFELIGQFEEAFCGMYEDQVFFSKIMLHRPIYVADNCWVRYRQHAQSCSVKNEHQSYYALRWPLVTWWKQYLSDQGIQDADVIQLVDQELWRCRHPRIAPVLVRLQYYLDRVKHLLQSLVPASTQRLS